MTRQAHPAHEVDLDHLLPLVVPDLLERARLEDAEIVDQDRDVGEAVDRQLGTLGRAEIRGERLQLCCRMSFGDGGHRISHAGLGPAVDDHPRTLGGQCLGDGEADARGGAGDERQLAGELQIHGVPSCRCSGRDVDHDLADGGTALEVAVRVGGLF